MKLPQGGGGAGGVGLQPRASESCAIDACMWRSMSVLRAVCVLRVCAMAAATDACRDMATCCEASRGRQGRHALHGRCCCVLRLMRWLLVYTAQRAWRQQST
eukprot:jgi/Ulvmu1/8856/UM049_0038.1